MAGDGTPAGRLRAAAAATLVAAGDLAAILTAEQGKPLKAAAFEVTETARWFEYSAGPGATQRRSSRTTRRARRSWCTVRWASSPRSRRGISRSFFPAWKLAPALAGNTIVLKPSAFTPLSTMAAGGINDGDLPPGVLNVVSGGDALGVLVHRSSDGS